MGAARETMGFPPPQSSLREGGGQMGREEVRRRGKRSDGGAAAVGAEEVPRTLVEVVEADLERGLERADFEREVDLPAEQEHDERRCERRDYPLRNL